MQAVRVGTESQDVAGQLVNVGDKLVAVLVRLDDPAHGAEERGCWYLEAGFGVCNVRTAPLFGDLGAARAWIGRRVAAGHARAMAASAAQGVLMSGFRQHNRHISNQDCE